MDYEKAYKESFGVAKSLHEAGDVITKKQMERLFPQLVESDDEWNLRKVRRAIRGFFTNPIDANELLAWLEKQKEQKQVEYIDFDNEFENQVSHLLASILNGEHEYNEGFVKYAAQSLLGYAKNEMKPDEWDKREKLFTKALQTANIQIGQLFEENKKLKEQKPVEWSEEDSRMLSDIAGYISGVGSSSGITKRERVDFLYELPKRFNLQPKQEWSEEDGRIIDTIVSVLGQYIDYKTVSGTGSGYATPRYNKEIDWLKSLRPQSHWKPSEEQMKALYSALNDAISLYSNEVSPPYEEISRMHFDVLESLYNDLKKL